MGKSVRATEVLEEPYVVNSGSLWRGKPKGIATSRLVTGKSARATLRGEGRYDRQGSY